MFNIAERDAILRTDFLSFAQAAFAELYPDEHFEPNWHHEAIAALLTQSRRIKTCKYINAPPRSLKSFLVSTAWVAWTLGHEPTHKFICTSYSRELASHLASECRRLMNSVLYSHLFLTQLSKATEDELTTVEGGQRIATSVGGTLTGLGADTIIIDDPLNANDGYNEIARNRVNEWYVNSLQHRLNDKRAGAIFLVTHRLHQCDLTGYLVRNFGWDGLVLPATAPCDQTITVGNWKHTWKKSEPLQMTREPLKTLEDARKDNDSFASQYMQNPLPETGNMLNPAWVQWCPATPTYQPGDKIFLSCDTAMKANSTCNFSVWLVLLVRNDKIYLIDNWRKRAEFPDLCTASVELIKKWKPETVLIEDHALGSPLISQLERLHIAGIVAIRPSTDKQSRMKGVTPFLEGEGIILPQDAPWTDEFLREFRAFPAGEFDDQMDALSQFLKWWVERDPPVKFTADFGGSPLGRLPGWSVAPLGAPSPEAMLSFLGR